MHLLMEFPKITCFYRIDKKMVCRVLTPHWRQITTERGVAETDVEWSDVIWASFGLKVACRTLMILAYRRLGTTICARASAVPVRSDSLKTCSMQKAVRTWGEPARSEHLGEKYRTMGMLGVSVVYRWPKA